MSACPSFPSIIMRVCFKRIWIILRMKMWTIQRERERELEVEYDCSFDSFHSKRYDYDSLLFFSSSISFLSSFSPFLSFPLNGHQLFETINLQWVNQGWMDAFIYSFEQEREKKDGIKFLSICFLLSLLPSFLPSLSVSLDFFSLSLFFRFGSFVKLRKKKNDWKKKVRKNILILNIFSVSLFGYKMVFFEGKNEEKRNAGIEKRKKEPKREMKKERKRRRVSDSWDRDLWGRKRRARKGKKSSFWIFMMKWPYFLSLSLPVGILSSREKERREKDEERKKEEKPTSSHFCSQVDHMQVRREM